MLENLPYFYLLIWIFCWVLSWTGLFLLPKRNYIKNYILISIYFFLISLILIFIFRKIMEDLSKRLTILSLVLILILFLIIFLTYFFSNKFVKKPLEFLAKYSHVSYLMMDYKYLLSKSFEILYQQILIISLVFILAESGLNLFFITIIFVILFGFGHLPVIKLQKDFFGYFILLAGLCSSFLFPFLILNFKYGFIYTYIAHWLFYSNTGLLFWILESGKIRKSKNKILIKINKLLWK